MTMLNGKEFSTGNHPVEALVPMLHLKDAGFTFEVATPTGAPVVFEMWAMPTKDENVMGLYEELTPQLQHPKSLVDLARSFSDEAGSYATCSRSTALGARPRVCVK